MDRTEAQTLAGAMDQTRKLGKLYISKLGAIDVLKKFEVEGIKLNCALWIVAHMTWAEQAMLLKLLGGPSPEISWIGNFRTASQSTPVSDWPSWNEVLRGMDDVHAAAMKFISSLDNSVMDEPAYLKVTDWHTDKRHVIMHAIRHEGIHAGHLNWLCKLHGIKTF